MVEVSPAVPLVQVLSHSNAASDILVGGEGPGLGLGFGVDASNEVVIVKRRFE